MSRSRTAGMFLLVTFLFGTAFPAIRVGVLILPPLLFASSRYYVAAVLLLAYSGATLEYWRPRERRDWLAVLAGGALFIGGTGFTFVGQQYVASGVAAIIVGLSPVMTVLFGRVLLPEETLSLRVVLGVVVGFAGVAIVVHPSPDTIFDPLVVGKLLIVTATVAITLGTVFVRRVHAPMPSLALTGWSMVLGASIQLLASRLAGEPLASVRVSATAVFAVAYLGIFAGALGFGVYFALLERIGPLRTNLVTYVNPVVALVAGSVLLGEPIQLLSLLGFGVIVLGFVILEEGELAVELRRFRSRVR